jgi:cell division transport system permease protein
MRALLKTTASRTASITTFIGTTLVLVLVAILLTLGAVGKSLSQHFQEQLVAQVLFTPNAPENEILLLKKQIELEPFCSNISYVSSEQAAEIMKRELGEDFVGFLGYNPLPASLDVRVNSETSSIEQIKETTKLWDKNPIVKEVILQEGLLDKINRNIAHWSVVLLIIAVVLLTISIALIVNTVELTVFSQRFIIRSMKLVGATEWFITKPFIKKSVFQGFLAGLTSLVIIVIGLSYISKDWPMLISIIMDQNKILIVFGGTLFIGVLVNGLATFISVKRFLRLAHGQIHG